MKQEMRDSDFHSLTIAYIGGGSRGWAWNLMGDLAREPNLGGTVRLYDIDREAAEKNAVIGNRLTQSGVAGKWDYQVADSLAAALDGADFVIISILPGTFDEMESDVHAPEAYGIYQSVGDTVGPGGLVRALRTIPMFVTIGQAIEQFAPEAWVINYTNPMSLCVRTLYRVFPKIKAFGCCHEVFGTQKLLALALKEICGIEGVQRNEIQVNVLGINHFTWLDRASYKGIDLFPVYDKFVQRYKETGYVEQQADRNWMNDSFRSAERVKMDLFSHYGLIAAAGDRHLAEFMPGWYLKNPETVREWKFGLTPVSWRKEDLKKRLARSERLVSGEESLAAEASGEEGILLMKALLGMGNLISNVNIPNRGQMGNLPLGAVVETNALFSRDCIAPVMAGSLPESVGALVSRHVMNQETVMKGMMEQNRETLFWAFMNDPLVSQLTPKDGRKLFYQMLENTRNYLPDWILEGIVSI
ncbi:MAG: alpha-glucosidase/alpha-galactosidase [Massiliimalia sp.]|jgi:alpha-galactosidase/6-phospho-beta-glucosidase family protein